MIHLTKGQEPTVLQANQSLWTQVLIDRDNAAEEATEAEKSRYNHPTIKAAVISETHGKCAYCESKFSHVTYGDIEHIVPKKVSHHYRFMWGNLTVACDVCNTKKGIREDLIDPFLVDPEPMFDPYGAFLFPKPNKPDAIITEIVLKLNRPELLERRGERIKYLRKIVDAAIMQPDITVRAAIIDDLIITETHDSVEFAAISRGFVRAMQASGTI